MNLLERYLHAVGQYLEAGTREDVLAELRVNLLAEMDARAEELERPLTEGEIAAILQAHGQPMLVAARYLPQRSLIGPGIFPVYLLTLRKAAPFVVLIYVLARALSLVFADSGTDLAEGIGLSLLQLIPTLLLFWGIVTMVFAILEFAQWQYGKSASANAWNPTKLPAVPQMRRAKKSLSSRVADLVVHCLWMLYVFAIPSHPYLILGPGALFLRMLLIGFAPVWHVFYVALVVLLVVQLALKILVLFNESERWKTIFEIVTKCMGVVATGMLAFTKVYFVATSAAANMQTLAAVNYWVNVSFRIVLFFVVLDLVVEVWKYVRRWVPTERLAF
jgi:hypothetical protein